MQANDDTTQMLLEVIKPELLRDFGIDLHRISEGLMTKEVNMGQKGANAKDTVKAYSPFMLAK